MEKLLKGVEAVISTYDFITGKKNFDRNLRLEKNDILIVERLHVLNEQISKNIPKKINQKYL